MRKFFWILLISVLLTGCAENAGQIPVSQQLEVRKESAQSTEPETEEPTLSVAERAQQFTDSDTVHIYDECSALSQEEAKLYNDYLEWLVSGRLMHAAAVITADLKGSSPQQFAEQYYHQLFDADSEISDGFLLLINNDTNQDYFYTTGRCSRYIPDSETAAAIAGATPDLIEENYSGALNRLLTLGEKMPVRIIDRTNTLTEAEIQEFAEKISGKKTPCAVMLLSFPEEGIPAENYLAQLEAESVLCIDPAKKLCRIAGTAPETLETECMNVWNEQSMPWAIRVFLEKI